MFKKVDNLANILIQVEIEDRVLTIFNNDDTPELYGISIVSKKFKNRKKYTTWDCILLKKESILKLCDYLNNPFAYNDSIYLKCTCFSELLELSELDNLIYFNIWDNYFTRYNKKIFKPEIWFDLEMAKKLSNDIKGKLI